MRLIIGLGHPAHYHLFSQFIMFCINNGIDYKVVILNKDILEELLQQEKIPYTKIINKKRTKNLFEKLKELIRATHEFNAIAKEFHPDLLIGCINQIAYYGWRRRIPSLFFAEDDFSVTYLQGIIIYPFVKKIITPVSTDLGPFKRKQIKYESFHELAYLHPNHFTPDLEKINHLKKDGRPYYIIRFSDLKAYHDINKGGIDQQLAKEIIALLSKKGDVYITSEKPLDEEFEPYRIQIPTVYMHHALYFADMFIGDSQTMTAEAAVLGTPALRYNNFVGRLGYLEELQYKYNLTYGFKPKEDRELISKINELLAINDIKSEWGKKRQKLLEDKIDYAKFMIWFLINYPESEDVINENPDYQFNFK